MALNLRNLFNNNVAVHILEFSQSLRVCNVSIVYDEVLLLLTAVFRFFFANFQETNTDGLAEYCLLFTC